MKSNWYLDVAWALTFFVGLSAFIFLLLVGAGII